MDNGRQVLYGTIQMFKKVALLQNFILKYLADNWAKVYHVFQNT